jgi:hypothetical protein
VFELSIEPRDKSVGTGTGEVERGRIFWSGPCIQGWPTPRGQLISKVCARTIKRREEGMV